MSERFALRRWPRVAGLTGRRSAKSISFMSPSLLIVLIRRQYLYRRAVAETVMSDDDDQLAVGQSREHLHEVTLAVAEADLAPRSGRSRGHIDGIADAVER